MINSPLVLCVPNFSEGRDLQKINQIAESISDIEGIKLCHKDVGYDVNRTVMSFVGSPENVYKAAYAAIKTASQIIDMRHHQGHHPRIGATDVCPFIPLRHVSIAELIKLTHDLGKKVAVELDIPVFMYEHSAASEERKNLANIRRGGYENLAVKILDQNWRPDYGRAAFQPRFGAMVIGARDFLIAFNINLRSNDVTIANKIARRIRFSGSKIYNSIKYPTPLEGLKAIGWYIEEYGLTQISTNITNIQATNLFEVFEAVKFWAKKYGTSVIGSEIIGIVPKSVFMDTGRYYLQKYGITNLISEKEIIYFAIKNLKINNLGASPRGINTKKTFNFDASIRELNPQVELNGVKHFNPEKRIVEYLID